MRNHYTLSDFCYKFEQITQSSIKDCYPRYWSENDITTSLLKGYGKNFRQIEVSGYKDDIQIDWDCYKFSGAVETKYGDIAVLVKIKYADDSEIEGIGFLEAKRKYSDTGKFDKLEQEQMKRIYNNAPHSFLLLYDYEPTLIFPKSINFFKDIHYQRKLLWNGLELTGLIPSTYSLVIPTSYYSEFSPKCGTNLYKFGNPLSYQFCGRYFLGLDLHFSKDLIDEAKGFAKEKNFIPYLMILRIGIGTTPPDNLQFNNNLYQGIE